MLVGRSGGMGSTRCTVVGHIVLSVSSAELLWYPIFYLCADWSVGLFYHLRDVRTSCGLWEPVCAGLGFCFLCLIAMLQGVAI